MFVNKCSGWVGAGHGVSEGPHNNSRTRTDVCWGAQVCFPLVGIISPQSDGLGAAELGVIRSPGVCWIKQS